MKYLLNTVTSHAILMILWDSYGEKGWSVIIHVLLKLFPLNAWNKESISPLTPMQATELVLLPETALSLIAEDIDGTLDDALNTLRESGRYGSLVFPCTDDPEEEDVEGDLLRERASIRCRQVLIEDRVEAKVLRAEGLWTDDDEISSRNILHEGSKQSSTSRPRPTPLAR